VFLTYSPSVDPFVTLYCTCVECPPICCPVRSSLTTLWPLLNKVFLNILLDVLPSVPEVHYGTVSLQSVCDEDDDDNDDDDDDGYWLETVRQTAGHSRLVSFNQQQHLTTVSFTLTATVTEMTINGIKSNLLTVMVTEIPVTETFS